LTEQIEAAKEIAAKCGWLCEPISLDETTLLRVGPDEEDADYTGPVRGILIQVHEDCDPIRLKSRLCNAD
jgi:hypothetical protein